MTPGDDPAQPTTHVAAPSVSRGPASTCFTEAYPALFLPAMRLAYRITADRALAEDLAAEAMARAYARWSSVSTCDSPTAWVLRVTTNLAVDAGRRSQTSVQVLPQLVGQQRRTGVADVADLVASRVALAAALRALPRRQREAIALRYLADLSEDEVSRALDIAPSSVRTHVQRGLASLRQALGVPTEVARVAL